MSKHAHILYLALSMAFLNGTSCRQAQADTITGGIQFFGSASASGPSLGPPVTIHFNNAWQTLAGTEVYSAVPFGTSATLSDFTFTGDGSAVSLLAPVTSFWSFTFGGLVYSFDLLQLTNGHVGDGSMSFAGTGIAHITGFEDTSASFSIEGSGNNFEFTFASSTTAAAAVPEGSNTGTLVLGAAVMAGMCLCKRRIINTGGRA